MNNWAINRSGCTNWKCENIIQHQQKDIIELETRVKVYQKDTILKGTHFSYKELIRSFIQALWALRQYNKMFYSKEKFHYTRVECPEKCRLCKEGVPKGNWA